MADLVDRHDLRVELEKEEVIAKNLLGPGRDALAVAFFEIIYRILNKMPFPDELKKRDEVIAEARDWATSRGYALLLDILAKADDSSGKSAD